ncbi:hypothetical protein CBS101457_006049 [Exobasidium rhododendri]|nr:hypothetical protein CBS101457_006049 [Exobasidium rhododendri]
MASLRVSVPSNTAASTSTSNTINALYLQSRLRPTNLRVSSSTTAAEEEKVALVSLDSMAGNNVESVMGANSRPPQRGQAHRSFTSPMQFDTQPQRHPALSDSMSRSVRGHEEAEYYEDDDEDDEEEDVEAGTEEYVVALHDFTSTNATCLSFSSGQVIKVFNRDESGWWDGELDGQRGWFPSNYVDEDGITSSLDHQSSNEDVDSPRQSGDMGGLEGENKAWNGVLRNRSLGNNDTPSSNSSHTATINGARNVPFLSRTPTPTANTYLTNSNRGIPSSVLDPIYQAISLLRNAVQANRVAHFQPSTACVITSVRSVLSGTDCLTRESKILKAHPILAKERKQILAELSKLVTQARSASAPLIDESRRHWEMEEMVQMADCVLKNVRRFLEVAIECGVAIPDRRSSVYDDFYDERRMGGANTHSPFQHRNMFHPPLNRSDQDKTPTPDSPQNSSFRTAYSSTHGSPRSTKSFLDLHTSSAVIVPANRQQQQQLNVQASRMRAQIESIDMDRSRSNSLKSETIDSSSCGHSLDSGIGSHSGSGSGSGTSQSGSCDSLTDDFADPSDPSSVISSVNGLTVCTPTEVLHRLDHANDHLLSIIAAFIGHIHSHTRDSHASSYAFLIDLTRATVDGVRALLVVVEAVHNNRLLQTELPGQMEILWETRENVYEATAALVTAARIITSTTATTATTTAAAGGAATAASIANSSLPTSPVFANEDEEKIKLLQSATAVLRTGGECVGAVKLCLGRGIRGVQITITSVNQNQSNKKEVAEENNVEGQEPETAHIEVQPGGLKRGKHTLSLLGRKASSLSCLREQYEHNSLSQSTGSFEVIEEEEAALDGKLQVRKQSSRVGITSNRLLDSTENVGDNSDASEPMSREHSRTSGSTLHSSRSDSTANTSARPSMEQAERENQSQDDLSRLSRITASPSSSSASSSEGNSAATLAFESEDANVCFNVEGQLTGATLQALVERMTPHDTTIDASFQNTFFLCFRLFTLPSDLFDALEARYNLRAPVDIELNAEEFTKWTEVKVAPVRLRVFNFFKMWLENHWNPPTDYVILERLIHFTQTSMTHSLHKPGQRLAEIAKKRQVAGKVNRATMQINPLATISNNSSIRGGAGGGGGGVGPGSLKRMMSMDRVKGVSALSNDGGGSMSMYSTVTSSSKGASAPPAPLISKNMFTLLRANNVSKINVVDFDPLELARQFTVMESKIYCSILPEELLGQEFSKKTGISNAVHVKTMSALSTQITGWISECILEEEDARKRTQLIRFFIKLGDRCLGLSNFNTLMAIQCALNSSTISRLKKTWDGLPTKYRQMMDFQRQAIEHTRNFAGYRQTLRQTVAPALPFVGLFLTDLTFCHEGNASTRPSPADPSKKLLNFDKYVKMSRIIGDLQRFQVPYNLVEVPEIQSYLQTVLNELQQGKVGGTADDLYRRSLMLEPRSNSFNNETGHFQSPATITSRGVNDTKLGLDLFNWK